MYLGIDIGTSAVKVCCMEDSGTVCTVGSAPLRSQHPFDGASEQNPEDWWDAVGAAITGIPTDMRRRVRAIGLSGQMHGAVVLDRAKTPIRPAILWNDGRASAECRLMLDREPDAGIMSGAPPMPGFTAPKLLWLSQHEPETVKRIRHVLLPKDYVGFRLHGELVTDPCDASGTGWFDQRERRWSDALCHASDTAPEWLPDVRYGNATAGALRPDVAEALGLAAGIPVVAGAGDAAAGAVGLGAVDEGDGFISLGTSGQLFLTTGSYRPNPEQLIHAYAHTLPDRWFQMAAMLNGARPMAWLAELLGRPIDRLLAEAEHATSWPLFLPYLTGERTPHGDAAIRAGFAFLDERTTPGSLMRSVIEAISFTFADAVEALSAAGPVPQRLLAIGGGTRSDLLVQALANATGCTLIRVKDASVGPALGAARLALLGTPDADGPAMPDPEVDRVFEPSGAREETAERLRAYRAFYPALKQLSGGA